MSTARIVPRPDPPDGAEVGQKPNFRCGLCSPRALCAHRFSLGRVPLFDLFERTVSIFAAHFRRFLLSLIMLLYAHPVSLSLSLSLLNARATTNDKQWNVGNVRGAQLPGFRAPLRGGVRAVEIRCIREKHERSFENGGRVRDTVDFA